MKINKSDTVYFILFSQIKEHYANIPRKSVEYFVKTCLVCSLRKVQNVKAPLKPILSSNFMQRCQVGNVFLSVHGALALQPNGSPSLKSWLQ